jgi:hypothetical protein
MNERALRGIAQKRLRHLCSSFAVRLLPVGLGGSSLCLVLTLELVISRGVPEQFVEARRRVVRRRRVNTNHALFRVELVSRSELESRNSLRVDRDKV